MPEITAIKVKNFRVFKDLHTFSLKPITLLTGPNNSGKSSLIKLINLLKLSAQSEGGLNSLDFDKFQELGSFELSLNDKEKALLLGLNLYVDDDFSFDLNLHYEKNVNGYNVKSKKLFLKEVDLIYDENLLLSIRFIKREYIHDGQYDLDSYEYSFDANVFNKFIDDYGKIIPQDNSIEHLPFTFGFGNDPTSTFLNEINYLTDCSELINPNGQMQLVDTGNYDYRAYSFISALKFIKVLNSKTPGLNEEQINSEFTVFLSRIVLNSIESLSNTLNNLYHLSVSHRRLASRGIQYIDDTFGHLILEYLNFEESRRNSIKASVDEYLVELELGYNKIIIEDKPSFQLAIIGLGIEMQGEEKINFRNLFDLGFGLTQIVAILLRIAIAKELQDDPDMQDWEPSILILEEPETNLHPNLQSRLIDVIADAASTFNMRFLIETHSPYIVRKLQCHTISNDSEFNREDLNIYYFSLIDSNSTRVKRIQITEDGLLEPNFGAGFLDEETEQQILLMKLKAKNVN